MTVTVGYLHPGEVSAVFAYSLTRAMVYETCRTGTPPSIIALRAASGQLVEGRNSVVAAFLEGDDDWLAFIDSDMGFGYDTLERLIGDGSRPAVGALCFGVKRQGEDDPVTCAVTLRCFPTIYTWQERDDSVGFEVVTNYERDAIMPAAATGAACFVVHRDVLAAIERTYGPVWFDQLVHPKRAPSRFSEDLSFWVRVAGCDYTLAIDTSVKTSHDKGGVFFTEQHYEGQQRALCRA